MAAKVHTNPLGWHEGESQMHRLLRVPEDDNPSSFGLSPHATRLLHLSSMLALGILDDDDRPWTTLLGGESGFARSLGASVVAVKATVGGTYDPVIEAVVGAHSKGKSLSALGIHLDSRDRVKLSGRLLGGGLTGSSHTASDDFKDSAIELQMAFIVERSLGNCPKYLNKKTLIPSIPQPTLTSTSFPLCGAAVDLLSRADTFFISTSYHGLNMGTNHRGGPPGFVRLALNTPQRCTLIFPEYSGNRLYQTLGNLSTTPKAGLVFPDFETGDVLYVTGTTEITHGEAAAHILPRSNLLVKIHISALRYVQHGLSFRATAGEPSPYNPPIRYLATEQHSAAADPEPLDNGHAASATLIAKTILTPTIARFQFRISYPPKTAARPHWKAGQYVALAFENEVGLGYSHMRDDDPRSLNDDYVRTFTISSPPPPPPPPPLPAFSASILKSNASNEPVFFEMTIRNVGTVTDFLYRQNPRSGLEVPLRGFGGSFSIFSQQEEGGDAATAVAESVCSKPTQTGMKEVIPFIAGGIGITPLLAHLPALDDLARLRLYWAVHVSDLGLVINTLERWPGLADERAGTRVFVSGVAVGGGDGGDDDDDDARRGMHQRLKRVQSMLGEERVVQRRMVRSDLDLGKDSLAAVAETWYLCAGKAMRKELLGWLEGKRCVFEDFDY